MIVGQLFFTLWNVGLGVLLNTCLCIDLILTIKRPFASKEARLPKYIITSIIISLALAVMATFYGKKNEVVNEFV